MGSRREAERESRVTEILRARLHRMMRFTIGCIPFSMPLLLSVLWGRSKSTGLLVAWIAVALGAGLVQWIAHLRRFAHSDRTFRAVWTQTVGGLVWGLYPWMTMPIEPVWQAMSIGILISVLIGAANFASALRPAYIAFLVPAGILGSLGFFVVADGPARWNGLSGLAVTGFALVLAEALHRNQREAACLTVELHQQARTDNLTGLANRAGFVEALGDALERGTQDVGVVFLDLDGFKTVNDQLGHLAGDELLIAVAARLEDLLGAEGLVARYGGDEFTVVIAETTEIEMADVKRRINDAFHDPFVIADHPTTIRASVGVSHAPPGTSLNAALREADDAQYRAKRRAQRARGVELAPQASKRPGCGS